MLTSRATRLVASAALALFASAGGVYAQNDRPPLRGPDVKDASPPGEKNSFVRGGKDRKDQAAQRGAPMAMMRAINSLRSPETPEELRLSPEQDQKIKGVMDSVHDDIRAFREAHGPEIRDLIRDLSPETRQKVVEKLRPFLGAEPGPKGRGGPDGAPGDRRGPDAGGPGERRGPGGPEGQGPRGRKPKGDQPPPPPPGDNEPMDEMRPDDAPKDGPRGPKDRDRNAPKDEGAAMSRLKELAEQAPDLKAAETKAWNVLNDPQQAHVKGMLEKARKDAEQRRLDNPPEKAKEKAERKIEKQKNKNPDAAKPDGPGRGENLRERIPPELREKLRNMSPEERREAVRKWMEENPAPGAPKNPR
ncbi:MAG: hypothetical protein JNL50_01110 [Phycisphaerae bacterium]|nr:hypothetical protein [Phycisphaerae bacterium]